MDGKRRTADRRLEKIVGRLCGLASAVCRLPSAVSNMGRYIKKFRRIGHALGPSEERGFAMWVGYDIEDVNEDLSGQGFIRVDGWTAEQLAPYDIVTFKPVTAAELGIEREK